MEQKFPLRKQEIIVLAILTPAVFFLSFWKIFVPLLLYVDGHSTEICDFIQSNSLLIAVPLSIIWVAWILLHPTQMKVKIVLMCIVIASTVLAFALLSEEIVNAFTQHNIIFITFVDVVWVAVTWLYLVGIKAKIISLWIMFILSGSYLSSYMFIESLGGCMH